MTKSKHIGRGGKRRNAGRPREPRRVLTFSAKDAKVIEALTTHYQGILNQYELTEEQAVMRAVNRYWGEVDQSYQEAAEIAQEPYIL